MRDYDREELKSKEPKVYLQKWIDYGFWMGEKIEWRIFKKYKDEIVIEPLLKEYLLLHENYTQ